ncbi:MAG: ABC transporter ATP-binding protein [Pirellula sp.]|jgi:ABC-2 type transport system ATP-binding protein
MRTPVIQAIDVGKAFRTTRAVDGVSFEVRRGEIFALLGPNGAGKSTLVRMMIGMIPADQGAIRWLDDNGKQMELNPSQIGYLPEDRGLYKDQKVGRILEYFGQLRGLTIKDSSEAVLHWAERLEISQYLNQKLETLSKGNQQKVQVAAAVLHNPRVAFLDEPFSGLDPINQELMIALIRRLRDDGTTVLLSAHQLELVERLADRVLLLARGKQIVSGTINEVKSGEYGAYSLRITFSEPIREQDLQAWSNDSGLINCVLSDGRYLKLTLRDRSDAHHYLQRASCLGDVADFRGGYLSLHEIYLNAVSGQSKSGKQQLLSV